MIRTNHAGHAVATLHFRNAVYQGGFDSTTQSLARSAMVYFPQLKHLLACESFASSQLNGHFLALYDSDNYQFGEWRDNSPCGVTVFRLADIVVVAQLERGVVLEGSAVVVLLESHRVGVVLEKGGGASWSIRQKSEVYCQEQAERLIGKCKYHREVHLSLLKYINLNLNTPASLIKLRYLNGAYRFGFENGLGVEIDEGERITCISVDSCLQSGNASPVRVGQVYHRHPPTPKEKFNSKVFPDQSRKYFEYFKEAIGEGMVKAILAGFIRDQSYLQRSQPKQSKEITVKAERPAKERVCGLGGKEPAQIVRIDEVEERQSSEALVIVGPLEQSSRRKEQFLKKHLRSHQDNEDSLEKAKSKRYYQIVGGGLASSKLLTKPVNAFSLMEQELGLAKQKPEALPRDPLATPQRLKENLSVGLQSVPAKTKVKIFGQSPLRRTLYEFSPKADRSLLSTKSRQKIFPKQSKQSPEHPVTAFRAEAIQFKPQVNSVANDQFPSSPIQALKFENEKSRASTSKQRERAIEHSPSGPIGRKMPSDSGVLRKGTLTEYEERSSSIISEDMSNFQLRINRTMQANQSAPRKVRRQNDVYKQGEGQLQVREGRGRGNRPYL